MDGWEMIEGMTVRWRDLWMARCEAGWMSEWVVRWMEAGWINE